MANTLMNTGVKAAFPNRCVFCNRPTQTDPMKPCAACIDNLPWMDPDDMLKSGDDFTACVSVFWYEYDIQESIRRIKFGKVAKNVAAYAPYVADAIDELLHDRFDLITWVPVSMHTLRIRTFDQSRLLAERIGTELEKPVQRTLIKVVNNIAQSTLAGTRSRRENVLGAYEPWDPAAFRGKRILLIDDILTTGATLNECAYTLRDYGAADVVAATISRTPLKGPDPMSVETEELPGAHAKQKRISIFRKR